MSPARGSWVRCCGLALLGVSLLASGCGESEVATLERRAAVGGLPNGQSCMAPSDCASGFCSDGVCCNMACSPGNPCMACNLPGLVGSCRPAQIGTDPRGLCPGSGPCGATC